MGPGSKCKLKKGKEEIGDDNFPKTEDFHGKLFTHFPKDIINVLTNQGHDYIWKEGSASHQCLHHCLQCF